MKGSYLLLACLLVADVAGAQALIEPSPDLAGHTASGGPAVVSLASSVVAASSPVATPSSSGETPAKATGQSTPVFRGTVDLVALNVVVTDGQQKYVSGLDQENFWVFEDGVRQDVSYFAATEVPLDLALLLDTSSSMSDKMQTLQQAAAGFARTLNAGDRAMVVDIKDRTNVLQSLTGSVPLAVDAIRSTTASGGTALFNGLYLTIKELEKERRATNDVRRQAIVVMSDGDDTASLVTFEDVMEVAKQAGIAIYTITLKTPAQVQATAVSGRRYFSQSEFAMRALAQETGARSFFPTDIRELAGVYGSIAEELSTQYALGYSPKNTRHDGQFRRVVVQILDRPGVRTRTRAGYLAPR